MNFYRNFEYRTSDILTGLSLYILKSSLFEYLRCLLGEKIDYKGTNIDKTFVFL